MYFLRPLINSHWAFRVAVALPAILMLWQAMLHHNIGYVLRPSGEWAARLLIVTLAITPVRLLLKNQHWFRDWSMWLFRRRRDLGIAAFVYALLHLAAYVIRQSNPVVMLYEMQFIEYIMGWLTFAAMLVLAMTSNDWSLRKLGTAWKGIQRLAYVAAIAAFLHWLWIRLDDTAVMLHFLPLALLEAWRLWYNFARPSLRHPSI